MSTVSSSFEDDVLPALSSDVETVGAVKNE
jgi:hypothetical protein